MPACLRCNGKIEPGSGAGALCRRCWFDEQLKLLRIEEMAHRDLVRVRYCMWCGEIIERIPAMGEDIGTITHGLHEECLRKNLESEGLA